MITPEEIARLRELEKKATPGPWFLAVHEEKTVKKLMAWLAKFGSHYPNNKILHMVGAGKFGEDGLDEDEIRVPAVTGNGPTSEANRDYICAARNALPALLDEVERLRGLADHTDDQIKLTGMRAELNQLSLELDMARRDRDKAEADLAAALKRAEISEKALHEISTAFNSHWTDALNMQRIAKEALAAIAGVAKGGEG